MVTDDERREVAQRLRNVQGDVIPGTETEVHPIAGRVIGVACGYDLPDFQGLLGRLADLIEPDCNRDALLKLADEMESDTWYESSFDHRMATSFARRIREALKGES